MKVLVTGVNGQLGHDVMNELAKRGYEGVGVDVAEMDITDAEKVRQVVTEADVEAVIHCAAYTDGRGQMRKNFFVLLIKCIHFVLRNGS